MLFFFDEFIESNKFAFDNRFSTNYIFAPGFISCWIGLKE